MALLSTSHGPLFYRVQGNGPPLVMLHGLGRSSRHWMGFDRRLAKHFQVITIDARGSGRSKASLSWLHSISDLADDTALVLQHLRIPRAHIFGLSLGGMVALSFGLRHPQAARSLIVVNTSMGGMGHARLRPAAILAMGLGALYRPLLNPLVLNLCLSKDQPLAIRKRILARWKKIEQTENPSLVTGLKHLMAAMRFRLRAELRQLTVPTLVVYGSEDNFVSHGNSLALAKLLPKAELSCMNGAGHELTLDYPQELSARIVAFTSPLNGQ